MNTGNSGIVDSVVDSHSPFAVEFHEPTGTYRTLYDPGVRPASEVVVLAVAAAAESDPLDLPPLFGAIDPEALDRLFGAVRTGSGGFVGSATFEYAAHGVTVNSHGTIEVEPPGGGRDVGAD